MRAWERFLLVLAGGVLLYAPLVHAQQPRPAASGTVERFAQTPPAQQLAQARAKSAPAAKGNESSARSASEGDAQLRQRVEQLEEQLLDMQVVIGTLESLARNAGSPAPSMHSVPAAIGSSSDAARIDALETQVRALTAQLEQLSNQTRSLPPSVQSEALPSRSPAIDLGSTSDMGFGATIVTPGGGDTIESLLNQSEPIDAGSQLALAPPGFGGGDPKQAYETAYGYLLQQNYGAAQSAFEDFLARYPDDPLAGNAQYWLGESLYVRGQFKAAASAFLKGYQTYGQSAKAPDSLLKLAMSLDRLGQKEAACSSFAELSARFPNAPSHVKTRAQTERQRAGC